MKTYITSLLAISALALCSCASQPVRSVSHDPVLLPCGTYLPVKVKKNNNSHFLILRQQPVSMIVTKDVCWKGKTVLPAGTQVDGMRDRQDLIETYLVSRPDGSKASLIATARQAQDKKTCALILLSPFQAK